MQRFAELLGSVGVVTTFDYPYFVEGRRAPDRLPKLIEAHQRALHALRAEPTDAARSGGGSVECAPKLILVGKSMGGRVGCHLALQEQVDGVVCLGYPLRGANGALRDEVLLELRTPILFVQGTRDALCPLDELAQVRAQMTAPNQLHVVDSGDHSLQATKGYLRKRALSQADVEADVLTRIQQFVDGLPEPLVL
jgi:predicted alpha/beta-hydrolase family hydrolase